jgi:hypothetical protein
MRIKGIGAAADADDQRRPRTAIDGFIVPRDQQPASDVANAAVLLLHVADLAARLLDDVCAESEHAEILRATQHGMLAGQGLAAALSSLLETVERPTTLKAADLPRFPARVEAGVYFCLAALLHGWPGGEARVLISVSARDGRLGVVLFDPEASDFSQIATPAGWEVVVNRIAALNGTLASSPNFGGLIIMIDVPATEPY